MANIILQKGDFKFKLTGFEKLSITKMIFIFLTVFLLLSFIAFTTTSLGNMLVSLASKLSLTILKMGWI